MASRTLTLKSGLLSIMASGLVLSVPALAGAAPAPAAALAPVVVLASADTQSDAAPRKDRRAGHEGKRHFGEHRGERDGFLIPGLGHVERKLVDELSLSDAQSKLLQDARTAQKELRETGREAMKQAMQTRTAQLKDGKFDPRDALRSRDAAHAQMDGARKAVQDKWLAVWDSLQPAQQDKIVQHLKAQDEKRAKWADKKGKREKRAPAAKQS